MFFKSAHTAAHMLLAFSLDFISLWEWRWLLLALTTVLAVGALLHVVTLKRDPRSAAYWVALIALVPLLGAVMYFVFGINFIRRRGRHFRDPVESHVEIFSQSCPILPLPTTPTAEEDVKLAITLDKISRYHFTTGNKVIPLRNGDESMPPMLEAIRQARHTLALGTYIFEAHGIGADFVNELIAAKERGVQVRVMVDGIGTRYSWPPVTRQLGKAGVPAHRFMPNHRVTRLLTMNLRNHRKILIADGALGFTGGINIREGNMLARKPPHPIRDLHFQVEGPVVRQMMRAFAEDWAFCSGEVLEGPQWFPEIAEAGQVSALGIPDGPDEDMEVMPVAFFAALSAAREEVNILNPYFLPFPSLIWALNLCAVRGVRVNIVTPAVNNIPLVAWAARTLYPELLKNGCRIYESPVPFDHSKIFTVDGVWSFLGSTNWDPRSLRLNFEFNLACYDRDLSTRQNAEFNAKLAESREITLEELAATPLPIRVRNGIARLFIPLL
jgi:cardiolipin synthase